MKKIEKIKFSGGNRKYYDEKEVSYDLFIIGNFHVTSWL